MTCTHWLFSILLLIITCCHGQAPVFIFHPVSINTTEGSVVEFTCVANNNPTILVFLVDGSTAGVDSNKGFDEQSIMGTDTQSRTLMVTASVADNDNSTIRCQAVGGGMIVDSNTATLRVQGPLSSVVDLSYSFIDSSTVNISWSPPFTLPGTDITGYNISATSNGTTTNYFTSNSYYELSLTDITNSSQFRIYVNVSGYNGLDGESTVLDDELYLPGVPPSSKTDFLAQTKFFNIFFNQFSDVLQLNFSNIDASDLFPGECPIHANIMLSSSNGLNTISIPLSSCTEQSQILSPNITSIDLTRYLSYTATVSYSNLAGSFGITNTSSFNTYDLELADVMNSIAMCLFSPFSIDNAECTVKLVSVNSSLTYTLTLSKPTASNTVEERISIPGLTSTELFYITVYDPQEPNPREFSFSRSIEPIQPTATDTTPSDTTGIVLTSSSTNALTSPSPLTSTATPTTEKDDFPYYIVIIVPIVIFVILLPIIAVVIVVVIYFCCIKKKEKKGHIDVPVDDNPAYTSTMMGGQPSSSSNTDNIPTDDNPAYQQMIPTKSHYENITEF